MANNYECGTITPYFPTQIVNLFEIHLPSGICRDDLPGGMTYLYVEDGCEDWDELSSTVQKMLVEWKEQKPEEAPAYAYIKACYYCDKMRQDEFGGFVIFITPKDLHHNSTDAFVMECVRKLEAGEIE